MSVKVASKSSLHFTVDKKTLVRALSHLASIVQKRNTIPILSHALLTSNDAGDGLVIRVTDLDMEAVETIPATIEHKGSFTVLAHMLYDIARKLPDGDIKVQNEKNADRVKVAAGRSRFELATLSPDDFPTFEGADLPHRFGLEAADLRKLFEKTQFAMSTEETRYYLNGVYLHVAASAACTEELGGLRLRAVATDGHRLARVDVSMPYEAKDMPSVIVPRKAVEEVLKLLGDTSGTVEVAVSSGKIRFWIGGIMLTSKLVDGSFPDYSRVIPADNDKLMTFESAAFVKAVDLVSTLAPENRSIKLNLTGGQLTFSAKTEFGSAAEEIDAEYDSPPVEIGFNGKYLLEMMKQLGSRTSFRLKDSSCPALVTDEGDAGSLYILMPMRA